MLRRRLYFFRFGRSTEKIAGRNKTRGLENEVAVVPTGCMGPCNQGPLVKYLPEYTIYQKVDCDNVARIEQSQLVDKKPMEDILLFCRLQAKAIYECSRRSLF